MAYTLLSDFTGNTTLTAGTYWMPYDINGNVFTLTFNCASGPIIIKRAGDYSFANVGVINTTNSTSTNKVYWTDKNDDTIGDAISGSTGSPVKSGFVLLSMQLQTYIGGGTAGSYILCNVSITATNWEIRYANNKQIINTFPLLSANIAFTYITFKNCDYSSVDAFYGTQTIYNVTAAPGTSCAFNNISFDNTNTLTGTSRLLNQQYKMSTTGIGNIFIQNANTSNPPIFLSLQVTSQQTIFSGIYIKNAGAAGVYAQRATATTYFRYSTCNFYLDESGDPSETFYFQDCLFDATLTGYATYAISRTTSGDNVIYLQNCTFQGYTKVIYNYENGGSKETYITALNCCFKNNTQLLFGDDLGHQTSSYCGYYGNGETYWARGTGDFTADPVLGNVNSKATIDSTFLTYIPNGYSATSASYSATGSDTYDNLSIDESLYSPDGLKYPGTRIVNPGIYYKFTTFYNVGTGTSTLPKLTVTSSGTLTLGKTTGTGYETLPKLQASAQGHKRFSGQGSITLPKLSVATTTSITHLGSASVTLARLSIEAIGNLTHTSECALDLPTISSYSDGLLKHSGESSCTLPQVAIYARGEYQGVCSPILPQIIPYAEGTLTHSPAEGDLTLPQLEIYSEGTLYLRHEIEGDLTLPVPVISSAGLVTHLGSASVTLAPLTVAAIGNLTFRTQCAIDLPAILSQSDGYYKRTSELSITLPVPTSSSEGTLKHSAECSITLPQLLIYSEGTVRHSVESDLILSQLGIYSDGYHKVESQLDLTLPKLEVYSEGYHKVISELDLNLPVPTSTSEGHLKHSVECSITLPKLEVYARGEYQGSITITLPQLSVYSEGTVKHLVESDVNLPQLEVYSQGNLLHSGQGDITLPKLQAVGKLIRWIFGEGACTLHAIQTYIEPYVKHTGEGTYTLPFIEVYSESQLKHRTQVDLTLPQIDVESDGLKKSVGSSDIVLPRLTTDSTGFIKHTGIAVLMLPEFTIHAESTRRTYGDADLNLPQLSIWGYSASNLIEIDTQGYVSCAYKIYLLKV